MTENISPDLSLIADPLDGAPLDGLQIAFRVPASIEHDVELTALHGEIVKRLRREAQGLPMKTVQLLLIERIAFTYVDMIQNERTGVLRTARDKKEAYTSWVTMTQEFNRLLEKHNDKLLNEVLIKVQAILAEALPTISDPEERRQVRRFLQESFAEIEL